MDELLLNLTSEAALRVYAVVALVVCVLVVTSVVRAVTTRRIEDAKTGPQVTLSFDLNWVTLTLRYVVRYDRRRSTRSLLAARVLDAIDASAGAVRIGTASSEVIPGRPIDVPPPKPGTRSAGVRD